jgi:hypothetical protein
MVMANPNGSHGRSICSGTVCGPKCEETWEGFYGDDWLDTVNQKLHNPERIRRRMTWPSCSRR